MSNQTLGEKWEHFFKPEVRSSGRLYFLNGKVASSQPSDTEIQAYIKGSTAYKVSFKSNSVESEEITVDCTCPASKKGQFCKHIWATLLKVEQSHPDFLDSKQEIQKRSQSSEEPTASPKFQKNTQSEARAQAQANFKAKQADYRKQQYQKQKQRLKDQKQAKKKAQTAVLPELPEEVQKALSFFSENGFPMEGALNADVIRFAKKKLSRVFHPDIGGSHQEIVELNVNYEVLMGFVENQNSN